jgi:hypothetical protein
MAKPDGVFIFVGTYPNQDLARWDYDAIKNLHEGGAVGTYDAAVVTTRPARCTSTRTRWPLATEPGVARRRERLSESFFRRPSSVPLWLGQRSAV